MSQPRLASNLIAAGELNAQTIKGEMLQTLEPLNIDSVPQEVTAITIFWEQSLFNFLIPGATALTLLTMPILSPLAELLNIDQQTVVSTNA